MLLSIVFYVVSQPLLAELTVLYVLLILTPMHDCHFKYLTNLGENLIAFGYILHVKHNILLVCVCILFVYEILELSI